MGVAWRFAGKAGGYNPGVTLASGQSGGARSFELTLPAQPESVPRARHAVQDFAEDCDADQVAVATAVSEAVSNAVVHAYREGPPPGEVRIRAFQESGELVVIVEDDGVGMKPNPGSEGLGMEPRSSRR